MAKPILLGKSFFSEVSKSCKENVEVGKLSGNAYAHPPVGTKRKAAGGSTPERAPVKATAHVVNGKEIGNEQLHARSTSTPPVFRVSTQTGGSGNTANPRDVFNNDGFVGTPPALGLHAAQPVKAAPVLESPRRAKVLARPQDAPPAQEKPKSPEASGSQLRDSPAQAHGQPQRQQSEVFSRVLSSKEPWLLPHEAAQVAAVPATPRNSRPGVVEPTQSEAAAAEQVQAAFVDASAMSVEDLRMGSETFDPSRSEVRSQILNRLGFAETATIEKLEGAQGAFNNGIWVVTDYNNSGVILKLVPHDRKHPSRLTDVEKYRKMQTQLPNIVRERSLTFPAKVFQLLGPSGIKREDLVVMRKAPGFQLTHVLYHRFHAGCTSELLPIFKAFGGFMRIIHRVYNGMQHGDCSLSNVFYNESIGAFTLVDVADFGFGPYFTQGGENDVEHFISGLKSLKKHYGENLMAGCEWEFRSGYIEEELARG